VRRHRASTCVEVVASLGAARRILLPDENADLELRVADASTPVAVPVVDEHLLPRVLGIFLQELESIGMHWCTNFSNSTKA